MTLIRDGYSSQCERAAGNTLLSPPPHEANRRTLPAGFTLVELLVVIAIIGILIAVLLPAVQAARESARRSQCANNFKQVGLGLHNYAGSKKVLPEGGELSQAGVCSEQKQRWGYSWSVFVLPYIEFAPVYDHFDFTKNYNTGNSASIEAGGATIPLYQCPCDPQSDPLVDATAGITRPGRDPREDLGRTNMLGVSDSKDWTCDGSWPSRKGDGVLFNYSKVSLAKIVDGTSKTLLVGETTGSTDGSFYGQNFVIYTVSDTFYGINGANTIPGGGTFHYYKAGFSSYHPGGCQFLFCDGSVHFVVESIDQKILTALTTRDGANLHNTGMSDQVPATIP